MYDNSNLDTTTTNNDNGFKTHASTYLDMGIWDPRFETSSLNFSNHSNRSNSDPQFQTKWYTPGAGWLTGRPAKWAALESKRRAECEPGYGFLLLLIIIIITILIIIIIIIDWLHSESEAGPMAIGAARGSNPMHLAYKAFWVSCLQRSDRPLPACSGNNHAVGPSIAGGTRTLPRETSVNQAGSGMGSSVLYYLLHLSVLIVLLCAYVLLLRVMFFFYVCCFYGSASSLRVLHRSRERDLGAIDR